MMKYALYIPLIFLFSSCGESIDLEDIKGEIGFVIPVVRDTFQVSSFFDEIEDLQVLNEQYYLIYDVTPFNIAAQELGIADNVLGMAHTLPLPVVKTSESNIDLSAALDNDLIADGVQFDNTYLKTTYVNDFHAKITADLTFGRETTRMELNYPNVSTESATLLDTLDVTNIVNEKNNVIKLDTRVALDNREGGNVLIQANDTLRIYRTLYIPLSFKLNFVDVKMFDAPDFDAKSVDSAIFIIQSDNNLGVDMIITVELLKSNEDPVGYLIRDYTVAKQSDLVISTTVLKQMKEGDKLRVTLHAIGELQVTTNQQVSYSVGLKAKTSL